VEVVRCGQRVFCRAADIRVPRLDPILSKAGNCSRLHPLCCTALGRTLLKCGVLPEELVATGISAGSIVASSFVLTKRTRVAEAVADIFIFVAAQHNRRGGRWYWRGRGDVDVANRYEQVCNFPAPQPSDDVLHVRIKQFIKAVTNGSKLKHVQLIRDAAAPALAQGLFSDP
jgi:hypothetical protein